ncbi:hypothetical protein LESZY_00790 [Brevundimonas phage vB_BpoS-Leszy]|nr:hypothetical protein DELTA_103 [Brevundimonas phage vB_BsubS-Delta]USN15113.1 hypothetical protein LESZY_00790 [Brevundimonas phage vB_BpoS-Leszy]
MSVQTQRLRRYKRRKDHARTAKQFMKWSLRYHRLAWKVYGAPTLWNLD